MTPEEPDFSQDIIERREFTLADFIAQEGADFLKGESPVPKLVQVTTEIKQFIAANLGDSSGALQIILQLVVDEELTKVSQNLDNPVQALQLILEEILDNQELLYELVHRVDVKWGQLYGERPYFQQPNQKPHPEDEYTHNSVRDKLVSLLARLEANK
ncbi:MAG: hypothetical protein EWV55_13325 [Microcystis viridis Mv_BB_P_19951000_S69]|uniref:Uncharacterized protein n=1 Tax=Microcystis viridis Mv_BB_P_19951000_S68D TaxID=2486270 RepID=A0A552HR88_MICVR|nr:hypothetical protein [Microcystis aeruginosa LG13-11]TRU68700.1 MAG: hypothetical protein EWV47_22150 [Microcystis viridis Mv_BB_P_19951000_S68]TRU73238.1 MAG: hypothetical protein EWV55_13325 [Microcystis viridis Mv_BB_P_19951000_S69]TRU73677.1 MAG: hypothetical protein EWV77_11270 [Microcystis viridis Mv_BB_P_19951000_S68D]TRU80676.1 MAG: hypothetical protein EWV46_22895 [Microcystis viridis Mv_BB_P_19951000_S69D]